MRIFWLNLGGHATSPQALRRVRTFFPTVSFAFYVYLFVGIFSAIACLCVSQESAIAQGSTPYASPIPEIKKIILQKALHTPSAEFLDQLTMDNLQQQLHAMDSHARYIPPLSAAAQNRSSLHIGVDFFTYDSRIWIMSEPGGPASLQGVPEVGELLGINDIHIRNDLEQVLSLIDAAIHNNKVVLDIYGPDKGKDKKYTIIPTEYHPPSISMKNGKNAIILHVSDFISHETAPLFTSIYTTIEESNANIFIDLRGCPGGDLFEALEIAGMFIPAGRPLITTYDRTGKVHTFTAPSGIKFLPPTYVLIDNRTASAAEILAGILKSAGHTHLVGERSYGKCESQTVFSLSNGGQLWLTTLSIRFADDTSCSDIGIEPDIFYPDISITESSKITQTLKKTK